MPSKSKMGKLCFAAVVFLGSGRYIADTQSGFGLLSLPLPARRPALRKFEAEMLSTAVAMGFRVATVEIRRSISTATRPRISTPVGLDARRRRAVTLCADVACSHGHRPRDIHVADQPWARVVVAANLRSRGPSRS